MQRIKFLTVVVGALLCGRVHAAPLVVSVAGAGPLGWDNGLYAGDGGPAPSAFFDAPTGVAATPSGIAVADYWNDRVRLINTSATASTLAGDGWPGNGWSSVNGAVKTSGTATAMSLEGPWGVAARGTGIVFTDSFNAALRTVAANGTLSQTAGVATQFDTGRNYFSGVPGFSGDGGPATSAQLNWPTGVCVDAGSNVYVADTWNQRIRKISASGTITTVAGNGWSDGWGRGRFAGDNGPATAASLFWPTAVAVDAAGNIYIADTGSQRVRRVDAGSRTIVTIAGTGVLGNDGDDGPAIAARLNHPSGLAVSADGSTLYIADSMNHRIRAVDLVGGTITALAGTGARGFGGDNGAATSALFNEPRGLAVTAAGDLLVADTGNNRVREVLLGDTGILTGVVRDAATLAPLAGATVFSNGILSTADANGAYTLVVKSGSPTATAHEATYGDQADTVSVVAGDTVQHDFFLPSGTVTGHVTDDGGHIVAGATVAASDNSAVSGPDGAFSMRLGPGSQTLSAIAPGYGASTAQTITVTAGQATVVRFVVFRLHSTVLPLAYDTDWIAYDANPSDYNTPSSDYAFPADELPASNAAFSVPNGPSSTDFLFPDKTDGKSNAYFVNGQTLTPPAGRYAGFHMLEASQFSGWTGTITLHYSDGSSTDTPVRWSDWAWNAIGNTLGDNETGVIACDHRNHAGGSQSISVGIQHSHIAVDPAKTLVSISLPADPGGRGSANDAYLFAASLDAVGVSAPYGDVDGDGQVTTADAAQALAMAAGLTASDSARVQRADIFPAFPDGAFGDGSVSIGDALAILRKSNGL